MDSIVALFEGMDKINMLFINELFNSKGPTMIGIRKSNERGFANHGWLKSFHTFSFAEYRDPEHMGYGPLRVINEDRVQPGAGFGTHGHRDMEIISYVLEGALEHKDSMGNGSVIRPGDVQRMSAGTGVLHSEYNPSDKEAVHFLQIWIEPNERGITPGYEEKHFNAASKRGQLKLIASPDGRDGSVRIHQDAMLYAAMLDGAEVVRHQLAEGRKAWIHVARGEVTVNGRPLAAGDALKASGEREIAIEHGRGAEVLLFDLN
jgi:redox-sensitive bicupin YhaK (pirin superfamily)